MEDGAFPLYPLPSSVMTSNVSNLEISKQGIDIVLPEYDGHSTKGVKQTDYGILVIFA